MAKVKVSILIPVFNCEKYIEKCILSALSQTLKEIEVIVINDGSFDNSLDIINKFVSDSRIRIINKDNSGYGASLNIGIKEAKGEYISILEADDFLENNFLEELYSKCGYDVIKAGFKFYPDNVEYKLNFDGISSIDNAPQMINIKPSIWSAIYKKDFLTKNNIFFQETKGASYQDVSFQFKTQYLAGSIFFINKPLYNYRTDNESSSVKAKSKVRAIISEFQEIDNFLKDKIILPETYSQLVVHELRAYIWNFNRISEFYENEFIFLSQKKLKEKNLKMFYKSRYIRLKDKIKMLLLMNCPQIFKSLLRIVKKYECPKKVKFLF